MNIFIKFCGDDTGSAAVDWISNKDESETASLGGAELRFEVVRTKHPTLDVEETKMIVRHVAGGPVTILQAGISVHTPSGTPWKQGGFGQPAFSADRFFAAVRHPYGLTETSAGRSELRLLQHPGKRLEAGGVWESSAFLFGRSPEGDIRKLFDSYVHGLAKFHPERVWIYGDWALHDELAEKGRSVELTEQMTRDNVKLLKQMNSRHGIHFDYYMVDHGWYSEHDFRAMKQPNFTTEGLGWLSKELASMNTKLGLWFPVNTYKINEDGIFCGLIPEGFAGGDGAYCLKSEYGKHIRDAMFHAVEQWGVKLIKLDFADFECTNDGSLHTVPEAAGELRPLILREQESEAFLGIMRELNAKHPDVMIVAFNGFIPSPWWLETIDTLYIGDVQPSEVPAVRLRTSVNVFTEQRLNDYETGAHVHRHYLDDCGTFVGDTTTNFYLGKQDWRSQGLLSLGRGAKLVYYYGDFRLLDEADLAFLGEIARYDRQCRYSSDSYTLGKDNGKVPFAYIHDQYAAVYNPTLQRTDSEWMLRTGARLRVSLAPYEAQWIDLTDGSVRFTSGSIEGLESGGLLRDTGLQPAGDDGYQISVDRTSGKWVVYFHFSRDGKPVKSNRPSELCRLKSNRPLRIVPDHFCWNGIPWLAVEADLSGGGGPGHEAPWIRLETTGSFSGAAVTSESWWIPSAEQGGTSR